MPPAPPKIEITPNGPLAVTGITDFTNSRGQNVPVTPVMYLCRCGGSSTKPFCDGSHGRNGFSGKRLSDPTKNRARDYDGAGLTVHDNRFFCSHSGECTTRSPSVFSSGAKPWITPGGEDVERLIATIAHCPSGALSYSQSGVHYRDRERTPAIAIAKNGPYCVVGGPQLVNDLQPPSPEHYTLCRCGASKNKPFCDGSHWDAGFDDPKT